MIRFAQQANQGFLLSTAVSGQAAHTPELYPCLNNMARALKTLHALPIESCPFELNLSTKLTQAKTRWQAGHIDASDFDEQRLGTPVASLYQQLLDTRPHHEDLVFTHGDACLPNLLLDLDRPAGQEAGWVDLGRAGVADRWQDLALFCRSAKYNGYADTEIQQALKIYGSQWNAEAFAYYTLLDEFF